MKIAVLGAGNIGSTLAKKWANARHTIVFGMRNTDNPKVLALVKSLGGQSCVDTVENAIAFGEVVVFAIPGAAMDETITAHAKALDGKIIIDPANKKASIMNSSVAFATQTPRAKIFRAFNTLGWENFENPQFGGVQADLFYCGPSGEPQTIVEKLIVEVGLRPIRLGDLNQVDLVDMITRLWATLAREQGLGRELAFKMLTR